MNIFLPSKELTRLSFLQDIICDRKRYFYCHEIKQRQLQRNWSEYALVNVWPQVKDNELLRQYLPATEMDGGKFPNREFVWSIIFSIIPQWGNRYTHEVMQVRFAKPVKNFDERKIIKVSDAWLEKLNHFEFKSKIRK